MNVIKAGDKQKYKLQLIIETFLILGKIYEAKGGLTLTEICQSMHITKNRGFRMLATLIQCGMLEKDDRSNYKIGIASIKYAHKILAKAASLDKARPMMANLAKTINEAVYFAKYIGPEAVLVDFVDCCQPIKSSSFVGAATQRQRVTHGASVAKTGDITIDTGGLSAEITTVSMPYFNEHGVDIGSIVVLAPTYRMTPNRINTEIIPALRDVMQHQQVQSHDSEQVRLLPVLLSHAGREYAKYPHLVPGMRAKRPKPNHQIAI